MSALVHMVSSAARFCLSALGLWLALVAWSGCATSHSVTALPDGVTVHTFRRDDTNAHVVSRGEAFSMVDSASRRTLPRSPSICAARGSSRHDSRRESSRTGTPTTREEPRGFDDSSAPGSSGGRTCRTSRPARTTTSAPRGARELAAGPDESLLSPGSHRSCQRGDVRTSIEVDVAGLDLGDIIVNRGCPARRRCWPWNPIALCFCPPSRSLPGPS
jgi:hypothetical protein